MKDFSHSVVNLINEIQNANRVVVYGARMMAKYIIPVCETFIDRLKISIVVTEKKEGEEPEYVSGYEVHGINEIAIDEYTIVLLAMAEQHFDEVSQMPQLSMAKCVIALSFPLVMEAKSYAIYHSLGKLGIDIRLFSHLRRNDIAYEVNVGDERINSITSKAYELATEETARYVSKKLRTAEVFLCRDEYYCWLTELIRNSQTDKGINLEFGVADGATLCKFANDEINTFYGFDSFEGLPEDWYGGIYNKGDFARIGLPKVPDNVELIKGWFDETLPLFITRNDISGKKADFIHVDCDLYTSAKTIFDNMGSFIQPGTIIAFDEYFNYPGWQMDEYRAFQEYVADNNINYEYLAYVDNACAVCVRILK